MPSAHSTENSYLLTSSTKFSIQLHSTKFTARCLTYRHDSSTDFAFRIILSTRIIQSSPLPDTCGGALKHEHKLHQFQLFLTETDQGHFQFSSKVTLKRIYFWLRDALMQRTDKTKITTKLFHHQPASASHQSNMHPESIQPPSTPPKKGHSSHLSHLTIPSSPVFKHIKTTFIPNHQLDSHTLTYFYCSTRHAHLVLPNAPSLHKRIATSPKWLREEDPLVLRLIHSKHSSYSGARSLWFVLNHSVKVLKVHIEEPNIPKSSRDSDDTTITQSPPSTPPQSRGEISKYPRIIYIEEDTDESGAHEEDFPPMSFFSASDDQLFGHTASNFATSLTSKLRTLSSIDDDRPKRKITQLHESCTNKVSLERNCTNTTFVALRKRGKEVDTCNLLNNTSFEQFGLMQSRTYQQHEAFRILINSSHSWNIPKSGGMIVREFDPLTKVREICSTAKHNFTTAICDLSMRSQFCYEWHLLLKNIGRRKEVYIGLCREMHSVEDNYCIAHDTDALCFAISCKDSQVVRGGACRTSIGTSEPLSCGDVVSFFVDGVSGKIEYSINRGRRRFGMRVVESDIGNMRAAVSFGRERYCIAVLD